MSGMNAKAAQAKLDKQIEQLGELRNGGTRAIEFREWRQTTLTLIERIWPDQSSRATRFRRIPFSPASANADDRVMREAFERGCAEARRLLRLWHAEIGSRGVSQDAEAPRLAEAVRQTLVEMRPATPPPAPRAKGVGAPALGTAGAAKPGVVPGPGAAPAAANPGAASASAPKPSRRVRKTPLGEMLGIPGAAASTPAPPEPSRVVGVPASRVAPVAGVRPVPVPGARTAPDGPVPSRPKTRAPGPELPPEFEHSAGQPAAMAAEQTADALAQSIDHALERARREAHGMRPVPEPMDPKGRTYEEAPVAENRTLVSYVARAFIALASDAEELGVPEAHLDRVRFALFDLANHLDSGSVTWPLMRDAVTLVMHYPALGRQALPLLLPFLENAA